MRSLTKFLAIFLLAVGVPITTLFLIVSLNPNTTPDEREGAIAALLFFGLPPTALGSWLIWNGYQRIEQNTSDRLRGNFFRLLKEGNGYLTVLKFAMETGLDGEAAKRYLDDRAREFNATFDVTPEGGVTYFFDLGYHPLPAPSIEETFDIILEFVPAGKQRTVVKAIHDLTGLNWQEAKAILKQPLPAVVKAGVNRQMAESYREQLEKAGAEVLIILN